MNNFKLDSSSSSHKGAHARALSLPAKLHRGECLTSSLTLTIIIKQSLITCWIWGAELKHVRISRRITRENWAIKMGNLHTRALPPSLYKHARVWRSRWWTLGRWGYLLYSFLILKYLTLGTKISNLFWAGEAASIHDTPCVSTSLGARILEQSDEEDVDEDQGEEEQDWVGGEVTEAETKRGLKKMDVSKLRGMEILSMFDLELPTPACKPTQKTQNCSRNTPAVPLMSLLPTDKSVIRSSSSPLTAPRDASTIIAAMRRPSVTLWLETRRTRIVDIDSAHVGQGGTVGESTCTSRANAGEDDLRSALHTIDRLLVVKGQPSSCTRVSSLSQASSTKEC